MKLLNKLPGYTPSEPGCERTVLRALPCTFALGLGVLMLPSLLLRFGSWQMHPIQLDELISKADIYAAGAMLCYCSLTVAITIGAIIVMVMKGPAYVADAYPLPDAERP